MEHKAKKMLVPVCDFTVSAHGSFRVRTPFLGRLGSDVAVVVRPGYNAVGSADVFGCVKCGCCCVAKFLKGNLKTGTNLDS